MERLQDFLNYKISLGDTLELTPKLIFITVFAFFVTWFVLRLFKRIVYRTLSEDAKFKFSGIFTFVNYFVYVVVVLITFDTLGIKVTALFAASAALLVGVGLALQTFIQDIISGIFIIADQSVNVGDIVEIDGQVGRVVNITLRTTRAVNRENKVLIIPNHKFLTSILFNWTENGSLTRELIHVGVAYNSDMDKVTALLTGIAANHPKVLKNPPPKVLFNNFGDSSLELTLVFTMNRSFEANAVKSDLRFNILARFRKEGIEIPFPQRVVTMQALPPEVSIKD
ncbi:MAG: mechanosensitive ion channel family protein [Flavobacteriaceae bacterium]|jgi:small-conductance mechanosensitive channel